MSTPAVAVSADGTRFAAAWKDLRAGKNDPNVYWSISDRPSFGRDALVHADVRGEQNHPALAMDDSGTVWAAWEDKGSDRPRIWVRSSGDSAAGRPASDPSEGAATFPALASLGGNVALVYETSQPGARRVVFRSLNGAAGP